nr:MAG TPA: hypothetical protein [Caudoviricetes sp.]
MKQIHILFTFFTLYLFTSPLKMHILDIFM